MAHEVTLDASHLMALWGRDLYSTQLLSYRQGDTKSYSREFKESHNKLLKYTRTSKLLDQGSELHGGSICTVRRNLVRTIALLF